MRRLHSKELLHKRSHVYTQKHGIELSLLLVVVVLTLFGLLMVYDASAAQAYQTLADKYFYIRQQLIWSLLGFMGLVFASFFDYNIYKKLALPLFLVSLVLIVIVTIPGVGTSAYGAHRWLKIGSFTLQPAEIIKLSSIIYFALLLLKKGRSIAFFVLLAFIALVVGLLQRDLGTTVVFTIVSLGMYFLSGSSLKYFLSFIPLIGGAFVLLITSSAYRRNRVLAFLDPFADPKGYTYHISQVLIALGSGGFWGRGIGQSRQKFNFIPEVTTDSIFAIVGEELGFVGCLVLISCLTFLVYKAFSIALKTEDEFGKLLACGIALWLGAQAVVNLGAMVSLIPLTGVPLPFISYGGSALLANLVSVGILLNISKATKI